MIVCLPDPGGTNRVRGVASINAFPPTVGFIEGETQGTWS